MATGPLLSAFTDTNGKLVSATAKERCHAAKEKCDLQEK